MKWTKLSAIISLALQQASTIQAFVISHPLFTSLDPILDEDLVLEAEQAANPPDPWYYSFSIPDKIDSFDNFKRMKKVIIVKEKGFRHDIQEDGIGQTDPLPKRGLDSHTGAIVPFKPSGAMVVHQGGKGHAVPTSQKGFGKGAKIATVAVTAATILGAGALAAHRRNLAEEAHFVKRGGRRGAGRTRAARAARAEAKQANAGPQKKGGMSKTKAGMILAGGAAVGAAAVSMTGNGGGGGDPNAAPA